MFQYKNKKIYFKKTFFAENKTTKKLQTFILKMFCIKTIIKKHKIRKKQILSKIFSKIKKRLKLKNLKTFFIFKTKRKNDFYDSSFVEASLRKLVQCIIG